MQPAIVIHDLGELQQYLSQTTIHYGGFNQHLLILSMVYTILRSLEPFSALKSMLLIPYTDCIHVALQLLVLIAKGTTIPSDAIADLWLPVWAWIDLRCRYIRWEPDDQFQLAAIHIAVVSRLGLTPGPKTGKTAVHPSIDSTAGLRFDLMCILPHDMAESKSIFGLLLQVLHG
jgi:hypothetical protein